MPPRAAFLTIGQTPRTDLVPELRSWLTRSIEIEERGALDGLTRAEIDALAPSPCAPRLVTRLADGSEAVLAANWVHERIQEMCDRAASDGFDITLLLCTGQFPHLAARGFLLDAQTIVDAGVQAIAAHASSIGVLVPHAEQMEGFHFHAPGKRLIRSHATPYAGSRWDAAATELAEADVIVMHCIGYTGAMRDDLARRTGKPVLLARRLVAAALDQLL